MNKQDFLNELEQRCDSFRSTNKSIDRSCMEQRDELIGFAKAAVALRMVTQPEAQRLIDRVDHEMFAAA